jgi:hypothetical protein
MFELAYLALTVPVMQKMNESGSGYEFSEPHDFVVNPPRITPS